MRSSRVVGTTFGVLALTSACATTSSLSHATAYTERPAPEPATRSLGRSEIDSMLAQAMADREGPRVSIRAEVASISTARRLRAAFRVEDDAYVLIGHVDADGELRIVFPADPKDDGFVHGGGRRYETSEFFAGFEDAYRFRYNTYGRYAGYQRNAYDASSGYLFIVASWRPMRFDKLASDQGGWDNFEVTEAKYSDARPAVNELAALVAGENREAYTVEFAKYYGTINATPMMYGAYSAFGSAACAFGHLGWTPGVSWQFMSMIPFYGSAFNNVYYYRGQPYVYDSFTGCSTRLPYAIYSYGYPPLGGPMRIGQGGPPSSGPITTPISSRVRTVGMDESHRNPIAPRPTGGRYAPVAANDAGSTQEGGLPVQVSQRYRQRGLITAEDPNARQNGGDLEQRRPSIQQMTERHTEDARGWSRSRYGMQQSTDGGSGEPNYPRARMRADDSPRSIGREPMTRGTNSGVQTGDESRYSRPRATDSPRSAPQPRTESPRMEGPRIAPEGRSVAPNPTPVVSAPPVAAPRSEPASTKPTP